MAAVVDKDKCNGCGTCVQACPAEVIKMEQNRPVIDKKACIECGVCVDQCPAQAIAMES